MGTVVGNGKVFISHTHADRERCQPVLAALDAWNVDYWFDAEQMEAGGRLAERIQQALLSHDIFLRICTPAALNSFWMRQERDAFLGLQATEFTPKAPERRRLIVLILEDGYVLEPLERATIFIDATHTTRRQWLTELRQALGVEITASSTGATTGGELTFGSQVVLQAWDRQFITLGGASGDLL